MRIGKVVLIGIAVFLVAAVLLVTCTDLLYVQVGGASPDFLDEPDYAAILSPDEMKEDLLQLKQDLEDVHPATTDGLPSDQEEAFSEAGLLVAEAMTVGEFSIIVSELVCMLGDAHTNSIGGFFYNESMLPMQIECIDNRFYILGGKDFHPGDELLSLGSLAIEDVYQTAKKRIPSENIYWINYVFTNFYLSLPTLTQLGADIDDNRNIDIVVKRDGERLTIDANFGFSYSSPSAYDDFDIYPANYHYHNEGFGYYLDVENNYCHFILSSCNYNDSYKSFLETMVQDIKEKEIDNIIVDLRGNTGGNSSVVHEFLTYVDIDKYSTYGCTVRLSEAASEQRGYILNRGCKTYKPSVVKNKKKEGHLFRGNIFALIDNGTFSAANYFGVILADNDLGAIIGEPSGNAPNCYGDILGFQLDNSKLMYSVSYKKWVRPGPIEADALYPDYKVTYTIEDYLDGRDLAMEQALELIKTEGD